MQPAAPWVATCEMHSRSQILTWFQLSLSNLMNTICNIKYIGNPAKDNRTTHELSYASPQAIPENLSSAQQECSHQIKLSLAIVTGKGFDQS